MDSLGNSKNKALSSLTSTLLSVPPIPFQSSPLAPSSCFPMNPHVIGVDISLVGPVSGDGALCFWAVRDCRACHCGPSRRCWWSHLFSHINSILSPNQGRTPAFHCGGGVVVWVGGWWAGWVVGASSATCRCYYSRAESRRTHICTHTHTQTCAVKALDPSLYTGLCASSWDDLVVIKNNLLRCRLLTSVGFFPKSKLPDWHMLC